MGLALQYTLIRYLFILILIISHPLALAHHEKKGSAKPLVDAEWLTSKDGKDSAVLLVDVRDSQLFETGHIPGAINVPAEWSFNQNGNKSRIAPLSQIRDVFSNAGIKNSDYVILYDDGMLKDAAHMYWVMETYGHRNVSVLNGGLSAWTNQGGKLTDKLIKRPTSHYIPSISPHHMSTKLTTRLAIENKNIIILDSRSQDEYNGVKSETPRAGHIPGAINIPGDSNLELTTNGVRLVSNNKLKSLYSTLDGANEVIAYCNRGKESALSYLVLRNMGISVSIYDGAWLEWSTDNNLPVDNPEK